jgi:hypothetical protein
MGEGFWAAAPTPRMPRDLFKIQASAGGPAASVIFCCGSRSQAIPQGAGIFLRQILPHPGEWVACEPVLSDPGTDHFIALMILVIGRGRKH